MDIRRIIVGPLQTNCYLLVDSGQMAVVDPGDEAGLIEEKIGQSAATLKYIINTHCHFDHTGAVGWLRQKYGTPLLCGQNELCPGLEPDIKVTDGQIFKIGAVSVSVMETPGHTPGGICLFGPDFVISGDTLFDGSIGRTDLPGGSDEQMISSLKKLDSAIPDNMVVYPGHGDIFRYKKGMTAGWIDYLK